MRSAFALLCLAAVASAADFSLPSGVTVNPSETVPFFLTLVNPAPSGGVFIDLSSSDPSKVKISPATVFVPPSSTSPTATPKVTGVDYGVATITASAPGLVSASQIVSVATTLSGPSFQAIDRGATVNVGF